MNGILIAQIILGIGAFSFLLLILRSKWLQTKKNIKDYEEGRDKLTHRKPKEVEIESSGGFSLSTLLGGFVTLLVGASLIGPISEQVGIASQSLNATSGANQLATSMSSSLLQIIPVFFAIGLIAAVVGLMASGFRNQGLV